MRNSSIILLLLVLWLCCQGCGLMPHFEYKEAKSLVPSVREYALSNLPNLSEEETSLTKQNQSLGMRTI